jgi:uncharacterized protein (DUF924 family)
MVHNYQEILDFWFNELTPNQWYEKDENLDLKMTERFIALHSSVVAGECSIWRTSAEGRLAEIIVIDQFSRNIYREDSKSFIYDPMALALAQETIRANLHKNFSPEFKQFLYMPFMHSESPIIHNTAMLLFSEPGLESSFDYELKHKAIIDRFGRYPSRNAVLQRTSTAEEIEFIKQTSNLTESNAGLWIETLRVEESVSVH